MFRIFFFSLAMCLFPAACLAYHPTHELSLLTNTDGWYRSAPGQKQIDLIISWQRPEGGWEKGYDPAHEHQPGDPFGEWGNRSTFDNDFTYTEILELVRAYNLTHRQNVLDALNRAIDFCFASQYPNGGWPQRFPLPADYGRDITYNDDAMAHVMIVIKAIIDDPNYAFIDDARREKAKQSLARAIDCTLKLQIESQGKLTAWAQQYDPDTLLPAQGRSFEWPAISASESDDITRFLMSIDQPSPEIKRAVQAAVDWYEASKQFGFRVKIEKHRHQIIEDPTAPPSWARLYEINTNRPLFGDRTGEIKYSVYDLEPERYGGYGWYGNWGDAVLSDYAKWKAKYVPSSPAK